MAVKKEKKHLRNVNENLKRKLARLSLFFNLHVLEGKLKITFFSFILQLTTTKKFLMVKNYLKYQVFFLLRKEKEKLVQNIPPL